MTHAGNPVGLAHMTQSVSCIVAATVSDDRWPRYPSPRVELTLRSNLAPPATDWAAPTTPKQAGGDAGDATTGSLPSANEVWGAGCMDRQAAQETRLEKKGKVASLASLAPKIQEGRL